MSWSAPNQNTPEHTELGYCDRPPTGATHCAQACDGAQDLRLGHHGGRGLPRDYVLEDLDGAPHEPGSANGVLRRAPSLPKRPLIVRQSTRLPALPRPPSFPVVVGRTWSMPSAMLQTSISRRLDRPLQSHDQRWALSYDSAVRSAVVETLGSSPAVACAVVAWASPWEHGTGVQRVN